MFRNCIRQLLRRAGYEITSKPPAMTHPGVELQPSVDLLSAKLSRAIPQPTFIQVGAYDGATNDPLLGVAVAHGWRGVLLEPQPRAFAKLKALYSGHPQFFLKCAALGATCEPRMLYSIRNTPGLPDWAYQISSFDRSHVLKSQRYLPDFDIESLIEVEKVPCITFERILDEVGPESIDVLQIDAEGFDYEVLKLFGIGKRLPAIVSFEHLHLSMSDWNSAVKLLADNGYRVGKSNFDTIAFRKESLARQSSHLRDRGADVARQVEL